MTNMIFVVTSGLCLLYSFERLLLHALCQYMDLVSASEYTQNYITLNALGLGAHAQGFQRGKLG